jgi:hypothetical protein
MSHPVDASQFTPVPATAEGLRRLAERVAAIEQRFDDQDDRKWGSTAWLIREVRTVALMTPNEGIGTLRVLLSQYDKAQKARRTAEMGA